MRTLLLVLTLMVSFSDKSFAGWGAGAFCSSEDGYCCINHKVVCNAGCGCEGGSDSSEYLSFSKNNDNPCETATGWREAVCIFAKKNLVHFAWGYEHGIRDYLLSVKLAQEDAAKVDDDVLFAAGLLHDIGGFPPYEKEGVDHAVRSAEVIEPVLRAAGFPMEKTDAVKKAILTHSYYHPTPPETPEAVALHDADVLDFLGAISIARILSVAGKEKGIADPKAAIKLLAKFQADLPSKLYGGAFTRNLGKKRADELKHFLQLINDETFFMGLPFHN